MNLKKNDKIIVVAAVVILIIAAFGAIMLIPDGDNGDKVPGDGAKEKVYNVIYEELPATATPDNTVYSVKDKTFGDGSYTGNIEVPKHYVKSVSFYVEYNDKHAGLLGLKKDTLHVKVFDEAGNKIGEDKIEGNGNITITTTSNSALHFEPIEAKSEYEANDLLEDQLPDSMEMETYQIKISLDQKEGFFLRFFGWLVEKLFGNDKFTLEVKYDYYDYSIEPPEDDGDDDGGRTTSTESESTPARLGKMVSLGSSTRW
jgi:hypothetical protein